MNIWLSREEHARLLTQLAAEVKAKRVPRFWANAIEECNFILKNATPDTGKSRPEGG